MLLSMLLLLEQLYFIANNDYINYKNNSDVSKTIINKYFILILYNFMRKNIIHTNTLFL